MKPTKAHDALSSRWPLPFWKMNGAGNDFVLIDHREPAVARADMPEFTRLVCRPKFGVGADGLIFLEPCAEVPEADFQWQFFNADGSEAEMCGNGARCAARFAYMNGLAAARMSFLTRAGLIEALVEDTQVTVSLTRPEGLRTGRLVSLEGREYTVHSINTGVPHAVLFVEDLAATDVRTLGRALRHHPDFGPAGTNVNFAAVENGLLHIRTYERGVEDETYACGTGAVASALIAAHLDKLRPPVQVTTSGGARLDILFTPDADGAVTAVQLKGAAHRAYRGELTPEALFE